MRFFTDRFSSKTTLTVGLNLLVIGAMLLVRFSTSISLPRPTLSLPRAADFSLANWFADRLADLVAIILDVVRHLIGG
ncbi:hypothetical protein [Fibrella aquatilis]|uniref:Uncharacterized protein n=1 Tax=Fibrella aquatilis TaxID=2817059 RepID=A0A939JYF2_9BACT|nr:hypothetical protein [Fibrella aquatilis]MBO0930308.1 hypothetical protein [Fibrella aquatilis]